MANTGHDGRGKPSRAQFEGFVQEIVSLARAVAPDVADLLDPGGATPAQSWSGPRERGLKLCLSMLGYARRELAAKNDATLLDRAEALLKQDLADLAAEPRPTPTRAEIIARLSSFEGRLAASADER